MGRSTNKGDDVRNIVFIGLVSFFTDLSTEMVYPLIPLYLANVFGATPGLIGIIEGIAESMASLLKVYSGYLSDRYRRKKPLAFAGYATSLLYKTALLASTSWVGVLVARVVDRFGKGVRTAPRDVLVSESSGKLGLGASFGLHKALDMAGSAAGILAAYFLVRLSSGDYDYRRIFLVSCVPAVLALAMFAFIKERPAPRAERPRLDLVGGFRRLDANLRLYLVVAFVFTLGNSSNTFLLLRAQGVGYSPATIILLYFVYNAVSSLLAIPFGRLSDRLGRKGILVAGYLVFSAVYALFALAPGKASILGAFALYGFYTALVAGVERAFIAEIAPKELKGTMLGLHSTIVGVALLPASVIAGLLWDAFGASAPFALGAALSATAALILAFGLRPRDGAR
jgi:MFS family permease